MKKKIIVLIISVVLASLFFGSGLYVGAAAKSGAGSQNDPVVSLSYLEYRLGQLEGKTGNTGTDTTPVQKNFEKKTIERGERLLPGEGGVIVLYSGACTAVGKGLVDLTGGTVISESTAIPAYSEMLVPSGDSGVVASETTVLFVIYGK